MKRLTSLAAIVCLTLSVNLLSAQEIVESTISPQSTEDPVAELTGKIMQRFFPEATLNEHLPNLPLARRAFAQASANAGGWSGPQAWPNFSTMPAMGLGPMQALKPMEASAAAMANIEQQLQQVEAQLSNLNQARNALAPFAARTAAPNASVLPPAGTRTQAIAMSVANGIYSIEAAVDSEEGLQKVRLNGTKSEVEAQIEQLDPAIREALGTQLGL